MKYPNVIFLIVCLVACNNNAYDAEKVAERYCECVKSNDAVKDFTTASLICDTLIAENRYIKLWSVDMDDRELDKKISEETRDSVKLFMDGFISYINTHCCKEVLACFDSTELK